MAKPYWLVKSLAIFTLVLFTVDTSSDGYVGYDLYTRCHYRYAASVLSFVAVPGAIGGAFSALILALPSTIANLGTIIKLETNRCTLIPPNSRFLGLRK